MARLYDDEPEEAETWLKCLSCGAKISVHENMDIDTKVECLTCEKEMREFGV